jgi:hypothetical protein
MSSSASPAYFSFTRVDRSPSDTTPTKAFVLVQYGQAADLFSPHGVKHSLQIVVGIGRLRIAGDVLHHRRTRRSAPGHRAHGDVTVGDRSDQLVSIGHGHEAEIAGAHPASHVLDGVAGPGHLHVLAHHVANFHRGLS